MKVHILLLYVRSLSRLAAISLDSVQMQRLLASAGILLRISVTEGISHASHEFTFEELEQQSFGGGVGGGVS